MWNSSIAAKPQWRKFLLNSFDLRFIGGKSFENLIPSCLLSFFLFLRMAILFNLFSFAPVAHLFPFPHNENFSYLFMFARIYSKFPKKSQMVKRTTLSKITRKVAESKGRSQLFTFLIQVPKDAPSSSQQTCQMIEIYYHLRVRVAARLFKGIIRISQSLKMPIKVHRQYFTVNEDRSGLCLF